ncbi:NDMA-dependent alcohol dehydrogenase [Pseudonocardia thermophila]|uniref:NDMA-dependent alcohol dehydrogenase n=1 Tax=Pseudonocardia thermophila TaxID=1848 RepID=UPI00248F108B|nr:NDMA-dependent alcohol dehydrogenase [Pseudonocardia thermophila]
MKTRAAVLRETGKWYEIEELELDPPKAGEVLVTFMAAGLCHTDDHPRTGDLPCRLPMVGGHEGAGVVEAVGEGVTRVAVGDHVACSFVPVCGTCRYCSTGRQNLCNSGLNAQVGCLPDGTFRFHTESGEDVGALCVLGSFSQYAVLHETSCVKIPDDVPFELAALVSCGVTTGWGSAVYTAGVRPGDTVVVYGVGGVGINAVQGARYAGARHVVAVDPVSLKLEKAQEFGATHVADDAGKAFELVEELTQGLLADHAICTVGVMTAEVVSNAFEIVGKGGQVTVTGMGNYTTAIHGGLLPAFQKRIVGSLFGGANPLHDIPNLLELYKTGDLKLDELITRRYSLEQVNDGYRDMLDGRNVRGVLIHDHA